MKRSHRVLITGTTSGLGKAFLAHYSSLPGIETISVNRREDPVLVKTFPDTHFDKRDITRFPDVVELLNDLKSRDRLPDLFVLNAGINRRDNVKGYDFKSFDEVMRINLNGVMTFVGAISELKLRNRVVVGISSTSNIIPNPGHIAYHLSKWSIHRAFELLRRNDRMNSYKSVCLGPVHTNIMSGYPKPTGLQGKIFDGLAVDASTAVRACTRFIEGNQKVLYYPFGAALFYRFVSFALMFCPGLYKGSQES
jgi:NADP-dependent 3-hydroxy acid dehydrogenase YdfG